MDQVVKKDAITIYISTAIQQHLIKATINQKSKLWLIVFPKWLI